MSAQDVLKEAAAAAAWEKAGAASLPASDAPVDEPAPELAHNLPRAIAQFQQPWAGGEAPVLRLRAIRLQGLSNVRPGFLAALCRPYVDAGCGHTPLSQVWYAHRTQFAHPGEPSDFRHLLEATTSLSADLSRLDLVRDITASLEPSQHAGADATEDVDILLKVLPTKRFFLKSNTSVGQSEGTASVQGKIRNVFGGAETLEGSATLGTRTRHAYNLVFTSPVLASPDVWTSFSLLSRHRDMSSYISAHEAQHTLRAALLVRALPNQTMRNDGTRHELTYEACHRHFHHMLPEASVAYVLPLTQHPTFGDADPEIVPDLHYGTRYP